MNTTSKRLKKILGLRTYAQQLTFIRVRVYAANGCEI